jgi:hypothetical protein
MTQVIATEADVGRACPFCRFPLKQGVPAERCDACNALHHQDCWADGGGCAVLGCAAAGSVAAAGQLSGMAPTQRWLTAPRPDALAQRQPASLQPFFEPKQGDRPLPPPPMNGAQSQRASSRTVIFVAIAIAAIGVGAGVFVAARGSSSHSPAANSAAGSSAKAAGATTSGPLQPHLSSAEVARARDALVGVLARYQTAYSEHSLSGLSRLFSPGVTRHGLAAGGCRVSHGREAVLADYESQFAEGTGAYRLVDVRSSDITLESAVRSHVRARYEIDPGGSGLVKFGFARLGESWRISNVDASCG